jgi:hypothetical protein
MKKRMFETSGFLSYVGTRCHCVPRLEMGQILKSLCTAQKPEGIGMQLFKFFLSQGMSAVSSSSLAHPSGLAAPRYRTVKVKDTKP